jgi:hypothetical protein
LVCVHYRAQTDEDNSAVVLCEQSDHQGRYQTHPCQVSMTSIHNKYKLLMCYIGLLRYGSYKRVCIFSRMDVVFVVHVQSDEWCGVKLLGHSVAVQSYTITSPYQQICAFGLLFFSFSLKT